MDTEPTETEQMSCAVCALPLPEDAASKGMIVHPNGYVNPKTGEIMKCRTVQDNTNKQAKRAELKELKELSVEQLCAIREQQLVNYNAAQSKKDQQRVKVCPRLRCLVCLPAPLELTRRRRLASSARSTPSRRS